MGTSTSDKGLQIVQNGNETVDRKNEMMIKIEINPLKIYGPIYSCNVDSNIAYKSTERAVVLETLLITI